MYFPNGLAGLYESHGKKWLARLKPGAKTVKAKTPAPPASKPVATNNLEVSK
jgi:urea transport system permease protein